MKRDLENIWDAVRESLIGWLIVAATILFFIAIGNAAEPYEATGIRVIDGDTIHVDVLHLGFGVALTDVTVRAADFDAWESSKRRKSVRVSDAEVEKGKAALKEIGQLFEDGVVTLKPVEKSRDRYGRLLAKWYVNGEPVAEWMKERGHVRD